MTLKRVSRFLFLIPFALAFASNVNADSVRVTGTTDYWFSFTERQLFSVRTFAVDGYWSDPMLWLYNQQGVLQAENDDYYGLQSRLELTVEPGSYRLRAGVCCGDPNRWYDGVSYDVSTNVSPVPQTTATTTTTTVETTTTEQSTTTTVEPTTTSVEPTTTVEQTTTVPVIVSTTWEQPSTTTTTSLTPSTFGTTTTVAAPTTTSTLFEPPTTVTALPVTTTTQPAPVVTSPRTATTVAPLPSTVPSTTTTTTIPPVPTTENREPVPVVTVPPVVTPENVTELVASIDDLAPEQITELVNALNEADTSVKKTFEEEVNVYSGEFDNYVPADSKIPVGERRVLVAIGATALASSGAVRRRN